MITRHQGSYFISKVAEDFRSEWSRMGQKDVSLFIAYFTLIRKCHEETFIQKKISVEITI